MKLNAYHKDFTIFELREAVGLTRKQLLDALGYDGKWGWDEEFLSRLETKPIYSLDVSLLQELSSALGVKMSIRFELPAGHFVAIGEDPDEKG